MKHLLDEIGLYFIGLSSMPQLVVTNDFGAIYLVYSSVTETYDNGLQNYRHIWARRSFDGGNNWGSFKHFTSELVHIFDECVYPACAANTNENLYLVYQYDSNPGTAVWGAQHEYQDNTIAVISYMAGWTDIDENDPGISGFEVSQNYPNPASNQTSIKVKLDQAADINLKVVNPAGQVVYEKTGIKGNVGLTTINLDVKNFSKGLYFYTISSGNEEVTRKLIIE